MVLLSNKNNPYTTEDGSHLLAGEDKYCYQAFNEGAKAQLKNDREWFVDLLIEKGYLRGREVLETQKPTHGNCCTCQGCGYAYDGCICEHNELLEALLKEVE